MSEIYECVPNVADGRDARTIAACAAAIVESGARLASQTSDVAHNRSVFTFFADAPTAVTAAVALARVARDRIDLRTQRGLHPRIGALDVLPFVPIRAATLAQAAGVARVAAHAIWDTLEIPSLFYDAASTANRTLPAVRRGEFESLPARLAAGERPDVGAVLFHRSAGAIAVGARELLVAFNIVLSGATIEQGAALARRLRERDGGLLTLRVLAFALGEGHVQISCNLTATTAIPLDRVVDLAAREARRFGSQVSHTELIGLVPRSSLEWVARRALRNSEPRV